LVRSERSVTASILPARIASGVQVSAGSSPVVAATDRGGATP
jgi:hypothetical protein